MNSVTPTLNSQKVHEVAESYRRRGYQVHIHPTRQNVPDFLNGYRPDLIAESADESVVVEVKPTGGTKPVTWQWLARTVKEQPNWRLELFVTDAQTEAGIGLSETEISSRFKQAEILTEQGNQEIALLAAWTATEAASRRLCAKYEVELPNDETGTVITRLFTDSLMERDDYDALMRGLIQRNAIVHGYKPTVKPEDLTVLHDITKRILAE